MYMTLSASPAYGRDYKSKKALLDDFTSGKDFASHWGLFSIRDVDKLKRDGITAIQFRYKKLCQTFIYNI